MKSDNNEVNEIKYKYQEEKRSNEELKARIMRLQKNMITSSVGHTDQLSNKVIYLFLLFLFHLILIIYYCY